MWAMAMTITAIRTLAAAAVTTNSCAFVLHIRGGEILKKKKKEERRRSNVLCVRFYSSSRKAVFLFKFNWAIRWNTFMFSFLERRATRVD
jgi:hypothetical protein